jgi:DNA-binding transcriptional LysR family regulator
LSRPEIQQLPIRFPTRSAWPGVELRHLIALQAVVAAGSFNAAAARLGYTQSAVSAQIRTLERLVGMRLLDRSRGVKGVSLTKEGTILLQYASEIVARFEAASDHLLGRREQAAAQIRLGTFASASHALLPGALTRFSALNPEVDVLLVERFDEEHLLDLLEAGELELAFTVLPTRRGPFASTVLCHEEHVALVPRGDALAERESVELEELAARPLVADASRHAARHLQAVRARGIDTVRELEDATAVAAFVAAGLGVGLVAAFATTPRGDVESLRVTSDVPPRTLAIAWHRDRPASLAARQFVQAACEAADALRGSTSSLRVLRGA